MSYIAHIKSAPLLIQTADEHRNNVANLAAKFASDFDSENYAYIAGWLHDKGKERNSFQDYIRSENGMGASSATAMEDHRHAFIGGIVAYRLSKEIPLFISNIIMGHHRGLYDDDELRLRLREPLPPEIKLGQLPMTPTPPRLNVMGKDYHHYVRMLFSCLVDADCLDTEAFMQPAQARLRKSNVTMLKILLDKLESYLAKLKKNGVDSEVNRIRDYVQQLCREESRQGQGVFTMTVPTGGGKTLSSLLWALRHALYNGQKHIIIAIPYTSIIAQTAATLKAIFGEENVIEHHSEFNLDDVERDNPRLGEYYRLATENWDAPIIVTTNVQLFQSLFSNKPSACRKLHNVVNSVIILDEAQTLPIGFLRPIVDTLDTLSRIFKVSLLFTTASQPVLAGRIEGANPSASFDGLKHVKELIPKDARLYEKLKRVEIVNYKDNEGCSYDDIAHEVRQYNKVLCIVNTRRDAKEIYNRLPKEGRVHLSRMMCSAHIKKVIRQIKAQLKAGREVSLRVVATQLIEAGVDIDFPVVFRQEAGLDSILQAAGRCNREGRLEKGETFVFSLGKEHPLPRGFINQGNQARVNMPHYENDDLLSPAAIKDYFEQLYCRIGSFDEKDMKGLLYPHQGTWKPEFQTAAEAFKLIGDAAVPVVVNYADSEQIVKRLQEDGPDFSLIRQLGQYTVNIRKGDLEALMEAGAIKEVAENIYFVPDRSFYKDDVGLVTDNHWLEESLIV